MAQWVNHLRNNIFVNVPPLPLLCEISGALHLAQPGLTAGWLAGRLRILPKVTIACNGFCLLRHTKTWLARDIISYSGTMFSRVLYYIVNFEIIALDK